MKVKSVKGTGTYAVGETEPELESGSDVCTVEVAVVDVHALRKVGLGEEIVDAFGLSWGEDVVVLCIISISINSMSGHGECLTDSFLATV